MEQKLLLEGDVPIWISLAQAVLNLSPTQNQAPQIPPPLIPPRPQNQTISALYEPDDEDVPFPTIASEREKRMRAMAHVRKRLAELEREAAAEQFAFKIGTSGLRFPTHYWSESQASRRSNLSISGSGSKRAQNLWWKMSPTERKLTDLAAKMRIPPSAAPMMFEQDGTLSRSWLWVIAPGVFDRWGKLAEEFREMERPGSVPWLLWEWLKGGEEFATMKPEGWALGWGENGPKVEWLTRMRNVDLSKRELYGGRRVAFGIDGGQHIC